MTKPTVSVVIPTIGRTSLARAVESALNQTAPVSEVIVCNDGGPLNLTLPSDRRVRIIDCGPGNGGNNARQSGVIAATSDLVAFLDDDDMWYPHHIASVLATIPPAAGDTWIGASLVVVAPGKLFPSRLKRQNESLLMYAFTMSPAFRKGGLPTSTIVAPRSLLLRAPWRRTLRFHQDTTWLLDVASAVGEDVPVFQANCASAQMDFTPGSVSSTIKIEKSIEWAARELLHHHRGRRLYADFLLTRYPFRAAADGRDFGLMGRIATLALGRGRPAPAAVAWAAVYALKAISSRKGTYR